MNAPLMLVMIATGLGGCAARSPVATTTQTTRERPEVILVSDVDWQPLNPARGDASPMAANLWGDRTQEGPTGFLVKFVDGFSSPPHIHNVSYRGVVIQGRVHNDDPAAEAMWMPAGSFWTQPKGASHITSAQASERAIAYIEIDEGPYLVRPVAQAFESAEHPLNVHISNLVWVDAEPGTAPQARPEVTYLWGEPDGSSPGGIMVRVPAGLTSTLSSDDPTLRVVVIEGALEHHMARAEKSTWLEPGSALVAHGHPLEISCPASHACVVYAHATGRLSVKPAR